MKATRIQIVSLLIGLFIGAIGAIVLQAVSNFYQDELSGKGRARAIQDARQLRLAMSTSALDHEDPNGNLIYPDSVEQLVKGGYLTTLEAEQILSLNTYIFPFKDIAVPKNQRVAYLISVFDNTVTVWYSDLDTDSFEAK